MGGERQTGSRAAGNEVGGREDRGFAFRVRTWEREACGMLGSYQNL